MDVVVMEHGGAARLLRNTASGHDRWLGVRLRQTGANTRALGAKVSVRTGAVLQTARVGADGSYLSQHATDLHFGFGNAAVVDETVVRWPDGSIERRVDVPADRVVTLEHAAR